MRAVKCFDVIDMTMEDTSVKFRSKYSLDLELFDLEKDFCRYVDEIVEENECESIEATIDEDSGTLTVSITGMDIICEGGRANAFYNAVLYVDKVKFSAASSKDIRVDFIIETLWRD